MLSERWQEIIAWAGLVTSLLCIGAVAGVVMAWLQRRALKRIDSITLLDGLMREHLGASLDDVRAALRSGGQNWQAAQAARVWWLRYRGALGMMRHRGRREEAHDAMVQAERALDELFGVRMPPSAPASQPESGVRVRDSVATEGSEAACG